MANFDKSFDTVKALVLDFEKNKNHYFSSKYQEAEVRKDFIDKFWIALGWDVNHDHQKNPYEQEVKVERGISVGAARKRADYAFYITPNFREGDVRFFVEAKKPSADLVTDDNCFQLVRYGFNSQVPVSILHNFTELVILDCRGRPDINSATKKAHKKYHYSEYINEEKFREIYYLFSRESLSPTSLEQYAERLPKKQGAAIQRGLFKGGYQTIDEVFLEELDGYRDELARMFKNNNSELDGEALTEATQRTLDRLVFMRFLEDKLIEAEPLVSKFGGKESAWGDFVNTSRKLDGIYNGIVFKKHALLDSKTFKVNDELFLSVCERLSDINTPYDFNAIPIHILGSIYERFLGKVIVATDKRARVEEKPEVRKAGGVYYTPEYVVCYIVENTVGKQIEGKTPGEIATLRFADIACGSGSFLLGVFDTLLRYHAKWYNDNPNLKETKKSTIMRDDGLHISLQKKREILVNNIFGVDIDHQAVEVAQLSLYLKLLQDETPGSTRGYQHEIGETLLPSLGLNIICGNSLIGTEILSEQLFSGDEEYKLNPMDYEQRFPKIMGSGGFDVIVGNPPYRRELDYKELMDVIARSKLGRKYRSPRMDLWYYFLHRALEITKPSGFVSFIVNAYWVAGTGAEKLISVLRTDARIEEIFYLGKYKVFNNVSGQHMVFRIKNESTGRNKTLIKNPAQLGNGSAEIFFDGSISVRQYTKTHAQLFRENKVDIQPPSGNLLAKLEKHSKLDLLGNIRQGIAENPSAINKKTNEKFGNKYIVGQGVFVLNEKELKDLALPKSEKSLIRPYHELKDMGRYYLSNEPTHSIIYSTKNTCPDILDYPTIYEHLQQFKQIMDERRETKKGSNSWWHLHWPRDETIWNSNKIISVQMGARPTFAIDTEEAPAYVPFSANVFVPESTTGESLKYILGILNSKLMWHWFKHHAKLRGVGLEINGNVLSSTPIRRINFDSKQDWELHDKLVALVDILVKAKQSLTDTQSDAKAEYHSGIRDSYDKQIDDLVYRLYGLTDEEIKFVENAI